MSLATHSTPQTTSPSISSLHRAAVQRYYKAIDANDTEAALKIFAKEARYERQRWLSKGWFNMPNLFAIRNFFHNTRKLRGQHLLESVATSLNDIPRTLRLMVGHAPFVYTTGVFKGTLDGQPLTLPFKDLWIFRTNNTQQSYEPRVVFRKSWITPPVLLSSSLGEHP